LNLYGPKKMKTYDHFIRRINSHALIFNSLPFVKEIAVCNSISFIRADESSDIDLLVILDSKRFFIGRMILTLVLTLFSLKRTSSKTQQRYCLSFLISDASVSFSDVLIENDVYFYYWFRHLIFLYSDTELQQKILSNNSIWFKDKKFKFNNLGFFSKNYLSRLLEYILGFSVFNFFENMLGKYQLKRAREKNQKMGYPFGVVIKPGFLKFHDRDTRKDIRKAYSDEV